MEHTVPLHHLSTHYAVHRFDERLPWLCFVHGFCADHRVWNAFVERLTNSPAYNLILPDLMGYGRSELSDTWTLEAQADQLGALLDYERINKCILVGHSMGGYASITFAERYARYLDGLLLFHTSAIEDDELKKKNRKKAIRLIERYGTKPFLAAFYDSLFMKSYAKARPEVVNAQEDRALQLPARTIIESSEAMIARPSRDAVIEQLNCPVGYVMGRHDTFTTYQKSLEEVHLPALACLYVLDEAGHMSMWEDTVGSLAAVLDFANFCTTRATFNAPFTS